MTVIEILTILASVLGGLALFLTGMNSMSDSLTSMTGGVLNRLIHNITKNRFYAFLFGTVLTAVVQSSSATTVLTVGLVNSGFIKISEAIGLVIGANLGTTATAWVLSLNAIGGRSLLLSIIKPSFFSPFLAIVGVFITMFCHSQKMKSIGSTLLGFSIMMIGMNLMSQGVEPLRETPMVRELLVSFTNPVLGFLFACVFAMAIQSSDAVIGILQAFALSVGITFGMAIPLICGAQLGTCITSIISALGASNNGKRTALLNLYYNLLKVIPFMVIFYLLNRFFGFSFLSQSVGGIGIPLCHTLVNFFGAVIWLPLSAVIVRLAERTIPQSEEEKQAEANTLTMLDENFLAAPAIALEQADRAVILLSETVGEAFLKAATLLKDPEDIDEVRFLCERSLRYEEQINTYLLQISSRNLSLKETAALSLFAAGNAVFGRMGKLAERILGLMDNISDPTDKLTSEDFFEIEIVGEAIYEIMQLTIKGYAARTMNISRTIRYYSEDVLALSHIAKSRFIHRIHEEGRIREGGTLYTDICYAEEQLIDYCDLLSDALLRYQKECGDKKLVEIRTNEITRQEIHEIFRDKFEALGS